MAGKKDWDELADSLRPLLTKKTLLVQSTDFSHYLPWSEALTHDRETLHVLASGRPELVETLHQPRHLDSRAAQYLQMSLQATVYNAQPTVIANVNSSEYLPCDEQVIAETTSYIVQLYSASPIPAVTLPRMQTSLKRYFFGGDFFTGRFLQAPLEDVKKQQHLVQHVLQLTRGAPLILNFEGVLQPKCPQLLLSSESDALEEKGLPPPPWRLCMPQQLTLDLLSKLRVVAASLANNHSHDLGSKAYALTRKALLEKSLTVLEPGQVIDFGDFCLASLTDVDNSHPQKQQLLGAQDLEFLRTTSFDKPLVIFIHWGQEQAPIPGPRQKKMAALLFAHGVHLIIGHHPHRTGKLEVKLPGQVAWSLGNFLFDQPESQADGALLELTFFPQGSFWVRQIPMGNLYTSFLQ